MRSSARRDAILERPSSQAERSSATQAVRGVTGRVGPSSSSSSTAVRNGPGDAFLFALAAYARVGHAVVLPRDWRGASLRDCLLVWFSEECMDDRPVSVLARRLELTNAGGALVQGPIVVCAFHATRPRGLRDYAGKTPTIHGTGQWVHVPNVNTCVRCMSRPFGRDNSIGVEAL